MIKKSLLTLVIACSAFGSVICADQDAQIERLLAAMDFKKTIKGMLISGLEAEIQQMPAEQATACAAMLEDLETYFTSAKFEDAIKSIYKANFTTEEISQIADFYTSEIGQKMVSRLPVLTQASVEIIQNDMLPIIQRAANRTASTMAESDSSATCIACTAECQAANIEPDLSNL